jgi:hypothetical protein
LKSTVALVVGLAVIGIWIVRVQTAEKPVIEQQEPYRIPTQSQVSIPSPTPSAQAHESAAIPPRMEEERASPELQSELDRVSASLPTVNSLKGMKEEDVAHRAPHQVVEAGAALGDLAEYLERHPSEFKSATPFYAQCALNESLLPAARALCLNTLQKKPTEWASGVKESLERVPEGIKGIAEDLE